MAANRELISAYFSVLHLPPLPVVVSRVDREDNTVTDDNATESSHSIIACMLEWAMMAKNDKANNERMLAQMDLLQTFNEQLANFDLKTYPPDDLYQFYCHHTRLFVNTFSSVGDTLRFKPLCHVAQDDKIHHAMRGYTHAQFKLINGMELSLYLDKSAQYAELLRKCAGWTQERIERETRQEGGQQQVAEDAEDTEAAEDAEAAEEGEVVEVEVEVEVEVAKAAESNVAAGNDADNEASAEVVEIAAIAVAG
jgi:hypothetical protein